MKAFADEYKKEFGKEPNFAAQIGYTGGAARRAGAEERRQGSDGRQLCHQAWRASRTGTTSSARRPMTFSATKHQGSNELFLCVVKDGKWVPVSTTPVGLLSA